MMTASSTTPTLPVLDLESPIAGVSNEAWTRFTRVMMVAPSTAVGPSNQLGAFAFTPRRLVDLGVLQGHLARTRSASSNRVIWATAEQEDRDRAEAFLRSLRKQLQAFEKSCAEYCSLISSGAVKLPQHCTLSGALSALHKAGPKAFDGEMFESTMDLFKRANGIF